LKTELYCTDLLTLEKVQLFISQIPL